MATLSSSERRMATAIAALATTNPFVPERLALEKQILGRRYVGRQVAWSFDPTRDVERPNVTAIDQRADELLAKLSTSPDLDDRDARQIEDIVMYQTFTRFEDRLYRVITEGASLDFYDEFADAISRGLSPVREPSRAEIAHDFALFFQLRRAFHFTYRRILGGSRPAAMLRAAVWHSIFTHDLDRYRRSLYDRMQEVPTLVTGPSGTGKELVASAIGWSRFIPYDPRKGRFEAEFDQLFQPLNLSALSPTLIEAELFGYARGAFTGAVEAREGRLSRPSSASTIFLDEIGDVDERIQVKLLRVLETRTFNRIGDGAERTFGGKIIAATHRDLATAIADGRFREDFYYRLCADRVHTPSLADQFRDDPDELERVVGAIAHRVGGADVAEALAADVLRAIDEGVGREHTWPGNVRELEQCVRNVLVRRRYRPLEPSRSERATQMFADLADGALTADEVLARYCTYVYVQSGSYEEAARRLLMDRRTVKRRVDPEWVARLTDTS